MFAAINLDPKVRAAFANAARLPAAVVGSGAIGQVIRTCAYFADHLVGPSLYAGMGASAVVNITGTLVIAAATSILAAFVGWGGGSIAGYVQGGLFSKKGESVSNTAGRWGYQAMYSGAIVGAVAGVGMAQSVVTATLPREVAYAATHSARNHIFRQGGAVRPTQNILVISRPKASQP